MLTKVYNGILLRFQDFRYVCQEYASHWRWSYKKCDNSEVSVTFEYDSEIKWEHATYEILVQPPGIRYFGKWSSRQMEDREKSKQKVPDLQFPEADTRHVAVVITEYYCEYNPYSPLPMFATKVESEELEILSNNCDGTVVIGEKRLGINKTFLAMHSEYFNKLFFGEFAEKDRKEIELKEIDYVKFVEFLRVILPEAKYVTKNTVNGVLEMANFFDCKSARRECALYLHGEPSMTHFEKLRLADQYRLIELEDVILGHLNKTDAIAACEYGSKKYSERLMARLAAKIGGA